MRWCWQDSEGWSTCHTRNIQKRLQLESVYFFSEQNWLVHISEEVLGGSNCGACLEGVRTVWLGIYVSCSFSKWGSKLYVRPYTPHILKLSNTCLQYVYYIKNSPCSTQGTHTHTQSHTSFKHRQRSGTPRTAIWHLSTCSGVKSSALCETSRRNFTPNGGNPTSFHQSSPGKSILTFSRRGISLIWSPLFLGIPGRFLPNSFWSTTKPSSYPPSPTPRLLGAVTCAMAQHIFIYASWSNMSLSKDSVFFPAPSNCPLMPALWIDSLQGI